MDDVTFAQAFIRELKLETTSTRKCLERIPMELQEYKPHEKSMKLGYLTLLVAEIPLWIKYMITDPSIDLATFKHLHATTTQEIVDHFDENVAVAKAALQQVQNGDLDATFQLKVNGAAVFSATKRENIESAINHMVHHRGQLTVYMRLNDIAVPSIYGPSADDRSFG